MKIYYAHSISLYNTPQEERDVLALRMLGFSVLNPNAPQHDAGYKAQGMAYFDTLLDECDGLAFRAHPGGAIPAGVAKEISFMKLRGKPIFELPTFVGRQLLSVDDTRDFLKEIGHR